jgi:hypothetical protein
MKTLKNLFVMMAIICLISSMAIAQKITDKYELPMCLYCACANDGNGEVLCGTFEVQQALGPVVQHYTVKAKELIGQTTGDKYKIIRVSNIKWIDDETAEVVMHIRNITKKGKLTHLQLVGTAYKSGMNWIPLDPESLTFYCR